MTTFRIVVETAVDRSKRNLASLERDLDRLESRAKAVSKSMSQSVGGLGKGGQLSGMDAAVQKGLGAGATASASALTPAISAAVGAGLRQGFSQSAAIIGPTVGVAVSNAVGGGVTSGLQKGLLGRGGGTTINASLGPAVTGAVSGAVGVGLQKGFARAGVVARTTLKPAVQDALGAGAGEAGFVKPVRAGVKKSADALRGLRNLINNIITIGTGFILVNRLFDLSDAATNATNRLRTVTNSAAELATVQEKLFEVSTRTRNAFESTAQIYQRTRRAAINFGISQQETIDIVESLNKAVIVSGASSREAAQGLIQLSQGLASNRLSGDELRSVLEQLTFVGDVIADEFNKRADLVAKFGIQTAGSLRQVAQEGALDAKLVLDAFQNSAEDINLRFQALQPTIGQAFTVFNNSVLQLVQGFQESTGAASLFARSVIGIADNLEQIVKAASVLAFTIGVVFARQAIPAAITATRAWLVSFGPVGIAAAAIGAIVGALVVYGDQIIVAKESSANLFDFLRAVLEEVNILFQALGSVFVEAFNLLSGALSAVLPGIEEFFNTFNLGEVTFFSVLRAMAQGIDTFNTAITATADAVVTIVTNTVATALKVIQNLVKGSIDAVNNLPGVNIPAPDLSGAIQSVEGFRDAFLSASKATTGASRIVERIIARTNELGKARQAAAGATANLTQRGKAVNKELAENGKASGKSKKATDKFADAIRKLRREIEVLQKPLADRDGFKALSSIQQQVGRQLTASETELAKALINTKQELERRVNILDRIQQPQLDYANGVRILNDLLAEGKITQAEFNKELNELTESTRGIKTFNAISQELTKTLLEEEAALGKVGSALAAQKAVTQAAADAKGTLTAEEEEYVKTTARATEITRQANAIIAEITGPAQQYEDQLAALNKAQQELNLSTEQYEFQLQRIKDAASGFNLQNLRDQLAESRASLGQFGVDGATQAAGRQAALASQRSGVAVDVGAVEAITRETEQLKIRQQILQDTIGVQTQFNDKVRELSTLVQTGQIDALQFSQQYQQAFTQLRDSSTDLATELGTAFSDAFDQAGNAIVNFAARGELNIRQLATTILTSLLRVFVNKTLTQGLGLLGQAFGAGGGGPIGSFLNAFSGGSFGAGGALAAAGGRLPLFADGGQFKVGGQGGTDSQLVQFMATPGEQVNVQTPQQANNTSAATVVEPQVTVVNVTDVEETARFVQSTRGEKLIMNVLNNNSTQLQKLLNRG